MIVRINDHKSIIPKEFRHQIGDDRYVVTGEAKSVRLGKKSFQAVDESDNQKLVTFVSSDSETDREDERIAKGAFHKLIESYKRAGAPVISSHLKWLDNGMSPTAGFCVQLLTDADPFVSVVRFIDTAIGKDLWEAYRVGAQRGISVGFRSFETVKDGGTLTHTLGELMEQSLCVVPMNPRAVAISVLASELGKAVMQTSDHGEENDLNAAIEDLAKQIKSVQTRMNTLLGDGANDDARDADDDGFGDDERKALDDLAASVAV